MAYVKIESVYIQYKGVWKVFPSNLCIDTKFEYQNKRILTLIFF